MIENDSFVYCWTDFMTGMVYVGSHKGKPDDGYVSSSKYFNAAYVEDQSKFSRQIIAMGDWTSMRKFEDLLIRSLWANNIPCYNKATGGLFRIDDAVRRNMSIASKGKSKSASARANMRIANGIKARDPIILAKLRKPKPEGFGEKVGMSLRGRKKSAEHCMALSLAKKGRKTGPCSEIRRLAISAANKGRVSDNKGKTYDEIYGIDAAAVLRKTRSDSMKEIRKHLPTLTCPNCGFVGSGPNMKRWHMDNCKKVVK